MVAMNPASQNSTHGASDPAYLKTASLTPKTNNKQPLEISLQIHPENFYR
jgi:hypothetical protein